MCFQTPADGHLFPTVGAGTWRLPWLVRGGGLLLRLRFLFPFAFGFRFRHGVGGADGHLSVWILFGEVDVLGAEANADQAGGDAAEEGEGLEELEEPGQGEGFGAAEDAADYVVLDDELEALGGAGWEHPSFLDGAKVVLGRRSSQESGAEDICGSYGVLNG